MKNKNSQNIHFNNKELKDFSVELHQRVRAYFEEKNLSQYGDGAFALKSIIMLTLFLAPYFMIIFTKPGIYMVLLLAILAGIGKAGIGFNIAHDACHGSYSRHKEVNRILGLSFNLIGMSDYVWKIMHNVYHHTYTNIYDKDEALKETPAMRFSPDALYTPIHKYQHIYALPAYSLYTLMWFLFYDFNRLLRYNGNGSLDPSSKHPVYEILILFCSKIIYAFVALIIPIFVIGMSASLVISAFVVMHVVAGLLTTSLAQPAHLVEDTPHFQTNESGNIEHSWLRHEIMTTTNFGINNRFLTWFSGGLNFQIEHHLFPGICSVHYESLSPIVQELTAKYDLPYHVQPGLFSAMKAHLIMLKKLGNKNYVQINPTYV